MKRALVAVLALCACSNPPPPKTVNEVIDIAKCAEDVAKDFVGQDLGDPDVDLHLIARLLECKPVTSPPLQPGDKAL